MPQTTSSLLSVRISSNQLASAYRSLVRKHFPEAKIVADRFHGIRLINVHFLACWRQIDPAGSKHRTRKNCLHLAQCLLGLTLSSWSIEIAAMWRFTRNNGITEGFHTKMEVLQRQAYGFSNSNNYRLRVKIMCS